MDNNYYAFQSGRIRNIDKSILIKDFENKARWYSYFLNEYLPIEKNAPILDVPCGHGNFLWFLRGQGFTNVLGIDIDNGRVAIAKELGLSAQQADVFHYITNQSDLSLIASLDFIEHNDKENIQSLIASYYKALRKGGILIIRTPITDSLLGTYDLNNDITHKWAGNSNILEYLLIREGFSSVIFKDERPVPYKFVNWIRLGIFIVAKSVTNIWLASLGFPPRRVWSSSGWYIARKP